MTPIPTDFDFIKIIQKPSMTIVFEGKFQDLAADKKALVRENAQFIKEEDGINYFELYVEE